MVESQRLRPVERRVLRWAEAGLDDAEIGRRFARSERWAAQVRFLAEIERSGRPRPKDQRLRPIERRILQWREHGAGHDELSERFRRSPESLARIEGYAHYKLSAAS